MSTALDKFFDGAIPAEAAVQETTAQVVAEPAVEASGDVSQQAAEPQDYATQEDQPIESAKTDRREADGLRHDLVRERTRRQESEELLRQSQQQLEEFKAWKRQTTQQPQQQAPAPITDEQFYADPIGTVSQIQRNERINTSYAMGQLKYDDFEDVIGKADAVFQENPAIKAAALNAYFPAIEAYKLIKNHLDAKNSVPQSKVQELVKSEAEVLAQKMLQAELSKRGLAQAAQIPPSLANARGSGGKVETPWREPTVKELTASIQGRRRRQSP